VLPYQLETLQIALPEQYDEIIGKIPFPILPIYCERKGSVGRESGNSRSPSPIIN
jgi:hypothetical protein